MTPITGDFVTDLHDLADSHQVRWACVHALPAPYLVDRPGRTVFVDGSLDVTRYYEAVAIGLSELTGAGGLATVTRLSHRKGRTTGSKRTG